MSERFEQTYGEVPPDYWPVVQELPPEYWLNANEVSEPTRLFEPRRIPGITPDQASVEARRNQQPDETVEIDMTIGVGEDPGWHRARPARQWKDAGRTAARQGT